jgi:hypothetical protein
MNANPQLLALQQIHDLCQGHAEALRDALQDMATRELTLAEYSHLSKEDRRLLDQFAYRYTRLQDDMGARLMPAVLKALGEDVAAMSAIDRFARLEQLGWLSSADTWNELRQIRNQFTHDYPDGTAERFERLAAAAEAARQLLSVMDQFNQRLAGQLLKP